MKKVWKYQLKNYKFQKLEIPEGAFFLNGIVQDDVITLYYLVDETQPVNDFAFHIIPTGGSIPDNQLLYLDTFVIGSFVWHVFTDLKIQANGNS